MSDALACAYALVASPPKIVKLSTADIPRNIRCTGNSTHEDQVDATACRAGTAFFEPLQHILDIANADA